MSELYLTAEQAAAELGISVHSLYAYVSRKKIRTVAKETSKGKYYRAEDVDRLKRGEFSITPDSRLVPESQITRLADEGPIYRGRLATEMAQTETLESTAAHLWSVPESTAFGGVMPEMSANMIAATAALAGLPFIDRASCLLPLLEELHPTGHDLSPVGYAQSGSVILRWFASLILSDTAFQRRPIHQVLAERAEGRPELADILRRFLVLAADHELSPSTYAVRATANTGVTPFQAVAVGLISSQGRGLPGGKTYQIGRLVDELTSSATPQDLVLRRFRDNEALPGFGIGVYPGEDPRASALLTSLVDQMADEPAVLKLVQAISAAETLYGKSPDLLVISIFVERLAGFRDSPGALMLLARIAGWVAHASEQHATGSVIRVRTAYSGPQTVASHTREPPALRRRGQSAGSQT